MGKHLEAFRLEIQEHAARANDVVNVKTSARFDLYIGRRNGRFPESKWANPFVIGKDGDRDAVLMKYRAHIKQSAKLWADLHELDGKVLGCWCHPDRCHGDVLRELRREQLDQAAREQAKQAPVQQELIRKPTLRDVRAMIGKTAKEQLHHWLCNISGHSETVALNILQSEGRISDLVVTWDDLSETDASRALATCAP